MGVIFRHAWYLITWGVRAAAADSKIPFACGSEANYLNDGKTWLQSQCRKGKGHSEAKREVTQALVAPAAKALGLPLSAVSFLCF